MNEERPPKNVNGSGQFSLRALVIAVSGFCAVFALTASYGIDGVTGSLWLFGLPLVGIGTVRRDPFLWIGLAMLCLGLFSLCLVAWRSLGEGMHPG